MNKTRRCHMTGMAQKGIVKMQTCMFSLLLLQAENAYTDLVRRDKNNKTVTYDSKKNRCFKILSAVLYAWWYIMYDEVTFSTYEKTLCLFSVNMMLVKHKRQDTYTLCVIVIADTRNSQYLFFFGFCLLSEALLTKNKLLYGT